MLSTSVSESLRQHSLKVILDNQQPGGAYLACPNMPDYRYSWFRDGGFIAYALLVDGEKAGIQYIGSMAAQWESAARFHDWCAEVITRREDGIERLIRQAGAGGKIDPRDTLNARYQADGSEGPLDWPEFQLDGVGTWLWSLREFVRRARFNPLPALWEQAADLAARYLAALWRQPCYDCWEERGTDIHISTLGAIYNGLQAADDLLPGADFKPTLTAIKRFVLEHGLTPGGELAKSAGLDMVDANLLHLALPGGMFRPDDPIIEKTIERIERELHAPGGGVHRHVQDTYYGGGAWVLLELWLAWYYAERGETERARAMLAWAEQQADPQGNLPEQVKTTMLAPTYYEPWVQQRGEIACPLLWTHAQYLIAGHRSGHFED